MPIQLASMAFTVDEKKERNRPMTEGPALENQEDYPYNLTIHLTSAEIQKLGFARGQLSPGDKVNGRFSGMVTSANASMVNGLARHEAAVQIQSLGLERLDDEDTPAETIYGAA